MEKLIAKDLLKIKAVFFRPDEPFTWASGIKSPVYCDNRLILTAPEVRNDVENGLATLIKENYPDVEVLMGTSTAGIAHAAIVGHLMDLPMGYVRSGAKDHGRQNQIEGKLEKGQKVVVVEDLISTGGSCIEVVNVLREAGAEVLGIVSIFTYGMQKGLTRLAEADVKNVSLTNFDVIAEVAAEDGYIEKDAEAFGPVAEAYKISKEDPKRAEIMEKALLAAAVVPMELAGKVNDLIPVLEELEEKGNKMALTDVASYIWRTVRNARPTKCAKNNVNL